MKIPVPAELERDHSGHYKRALDYSEMAMNNPVRARERVLLQHAQINATLAVYKFLLEETEEGMQAAKRQFETLANKG